MRTIKVRFDENGEPEAITTYSELAIYILNQARKNAETST